MVKNIFDKYIGNFLILVGVFFTTFSLLMIYGIVVIGIDDMSQMLFASMLLPALILIGIGALLRQVRDIKEDMAK